jgi:hypothetical protein
MIRYTVVWNAEVEAAFIHAWVHSDSRVRAILTDIANWVDETLAQDAHVKGQPAEEGARVLAVPASHSDANVSVTFEVATDDRQVRIIRLAFRRA